ncbi:hypothetical protein C4579_04690 [Candidatus Microgenomates bacterium]|nr:MAG: hypothetical protein C4579_04690 [Candidatus Microgenomates bacterium]
MKKLSKMLFGLLVGVFMMTTGAQAAHAAVSIYANDGGYYTAYGPGQYWYQVNNEGYCYDSGSCSPTTMKYTYSGCSLSNYAKWDNGVGPNGWATHDTYIPGTNAVNTAAPYLLSYNTASQYHFSINQNSYYDAWVRTDPSDPWWYKIGNVWLDDNPCNGTSKIGFDEMKIAD